jgi:hypothetical protein
MNLRPVSRMKTKASRAAERGKEGERPEGDDSQRRGIFTSGIVFPCAGRRLAHVC